MKPEIRLLKDVEDLSHATARLFIERSRQSIIERDRFLVALNGGNTPARMLELLATQYRGEVDWTRVHLGWGDERCVPPDDVGSSYGQARELLLQHVPIPDANVHRIRGELGPVEASREYAAQLRQLATPPLEWPRFDLVYLGMGEDGHTASLFPGSPLDVPEPTLPVTAHYQDRPANRVTLTPIVFNQAHVVAFMVTGEKKAGTLAEVLAGRYNPEQYPAQRIDLLDGQMIWFVDQEAAGRLPARLLSKFCEG
jgi:6-phosphogluconolactonase